MKPKEKAQELVKKYEIEFLSFGDYLPTIKAKQCALIAVEYIYEQECSEFWFEVKTEIEKL